MHKTLVRFVRLIAIGLLVVAPEGTLAQDARGTISGTVVDASKSLVPGASVRLRPSVTALVERNDIVDRQAAYRGGDDVQGHIIEIA